MSNLTGGHKKDEILDIGTHGHWEVFGCRCSDGTRGRHSCNYHFLINCIITYCNYAYHK